MQSEVLFPMIGLTIIYLLALFTIPYMLTRRAAAKVVAIFRGNCAMDPQSAKTADELGLRPQTLLSSIVRRRDYKSNAFQLLLKADVIIKTSDDRVYLSEKGLSRLCESKGWRRSRLCNRDYK
jgi:hypothetical protein